MSSIQDLIGRSFSASVSYVEVDFSIADLSSLIIFSFLGDILFLWCVWVIHFAPVWRTNAVKWFPYITMMFFDARRVFKERIFTDDDEKDLEKIKRKRAKTIRRIQRMETAEFEEASCCEGKKACDSGKILKRLRQIARFVLVGLNITTFALIFCSLVSVWSTFIVAILLNPTTGECISCLTGLILVLFVFLATMYFVLYVLAFIFLQVMRALSLFYSNQMDEYNATHFLLPFWWRVWRILTCIICAWTLAADQDGPFFPYLFVTCTYSGVVWIAMYLIITVMAVLWNWCQVAVEFRTTLTHREFIYGPADHIYIRNRKYGLFLDTHLDHVGKFKFKALPFILGKCGFIFLLFAGIALIGYGFTTREGLASFIGWIFVTYTGINILRIGKWNSFYVLLHESHAYMYETKKLKKLFRKKLNARESFWSRVTRIATCQVGPHVRESDDLAHMTSASSLGMDDSNADTPKLDSDGGLDSDTDNRDDSNRSSTGAALGSLDDGSNASSIAGGSGGGKKRKKTQESVELKARKKSGGDKKKSVEMVHVKQTEAQLRAMEKRKRSLASNKKTERDLIVTGESNKRDYESELTAPIYDSLVIFWAMVPWRFNRVACCQCLGQRIPKTQGLVCVSNFFIIILFIIFMGILGAGILGDYNVRNEKPNVGADFGFGDYDANQTVGESLAGDIPRYPICDVNLFADEEGLNMVDFVWLASSAYKMQSRQEVATQVNTYFGNGTWNMSTLQVFNNISIHGISGPAFYYMSHGDLPVDVLVIRGSYSNTDFMQDVSLWISAASLQMVSFITPLTTILPLPFLRSFVNSISFVDSIVRNDGHATYDQPLLDFINPILEAQRESEEDRITVFVGHSLGGGLAAILGAKTVDKYAIDTLSVGVSPPGVLLSSEKFGFTPAALDQSAISIVPWSDVVPWIDRHGGVIAQIDCESESAGECHNSQRSFCQLAYTCGQRQLTELSWAFATCLCESGGRENWRTCTGLEDSIDEE